MKLTQTTLAVLTNCAGITKSIIINPGNIIKIRTEALYAEATVEETFPEVGIYDLQDFVRTVALFKDPVGDFTTDNIRITESDGTAACIYPYARPGSIVQRSTTRKRYTVPAESICFHLTGDQWAILQKSLGIGVLKKETASVPSCLATLSSDGKAVSVGTAPIYASPLGQYSFMVNADTHGHEFDMVFETENLFYMPGPYEVTVTPSYTQFRHTGGYDLLYLVAPDPRKSVWGGKTCYDVRVTKSMVQDCVVRVQAHSADEAESLARLKSDEELVWSGEPRPSREFKAVAG